MANDFSTDFRCVALWRMENGALTTDSKGSNTLSDPNTCSADTTNFKEGSASVLCAVTGSKYLSIADASLSSTFPWRNADTSTRGTICFWVRPTDLTNNRCIISKWGAAAAQQFNVYLSTNKIRIGWGYSTSSIYTYDTSTLTTNQWYHVTIRLDMIGRTLKVRIWDDTAQTTTDYLWNPATLMKSGTGPLCIGYDNSANYFNGQVDEVVVFNDFLDYTETDRIRAGTFTGFVYSTPSAGLNDFSADTACKAYWRLEPSALCYDSKGSTHLTVTDQSNATLPYSITEQGFFREGTGSIRFDRNFRQALVVQDCNLPSGFPMKSDDATKTCTVCFWVKPLYSEANNRYLVGKYDYTSNKRSWAIFLYSGELRVSWSSNGTAVDTYNTGIYLAMNYWNFVAITLDGVNKYLKVQCWKNNTKMGFVYLNTATTNTMYVGTSAFTIGALGSTLYNTTDFYEGYMDEVVVFNRMLAGPELDLIRIGKYSGTGWTSANNFASTSNVVAQYRFESGALTTDSKSTNTLTVSGSPTNSGTVLGCREGSNAVKLTKASSQCFYRTDADLSADFPFKNGDTTKRMTLCFWMRPDSNPTSGTYHIVASKWDWGASKICFNLGRNYVSSGVFGFYINCGYGASGQTSQTCAVPTNTVVAGYWYHVTCAIDGVNQVAYLRVWDESAGKLVHAEVALTNPLRIVDSDFVVGGERNNGTTFTNFFDGALDEMVMFKQYLTPEDADRVRLGTFSGDISYPISVGAVAAQVGVRYPENRRVVYIDARIGDDSKSGFSWPEAARTLNTKILAVRDIIYLAKSPEVALPGTFTVTKDSFTLSGTLTQSLIQDNVIRVGDDDTIYAVNTCAGLTLTTFRPYRGVGRSGITVYQVVVQNVNSNDMNLLGSPRAFAGATISVYGGIDRTLNIPNGFSVIGNEFVALDIFENTGGHFWEYSRLGPYNANAAMAFDIWGDSIVMNDCYVFKNGYVRTGNGGLLTNFKANRCVCDHASGLFAFSQKARNSEFNDCEAFNSSWALADGMENSYVRRFKGGSFVVEAWQMSTNGSIDALFIDCNFNEGSTPSAYDLYCFTDGITNKNLVFRNCIMGPNLFKPSTYNWGGEIRFENFNRTDDQRVYYMQGVAGQNYAYLSKNDNVTYRTVPPSLRVEGSGTSTVITTYAIIPFTVACISNSPVNLSVWVRKNSAFGYSNPPVMRVRYYSGSLGSSSPGSTATVTEDVIMPNTNDTWVNLTKQVTSSLTGVVEVEFRLLPDSPASALFWIDDFDVT